MTPGPFGLSPEWITADATLVLAVVALISIVGLAITLRQNRRLAHSAVQQADLQWRTAIPHLRPINMGDRGTNVASIEDPTLSVEYSSGMLPAHDIDVWVRHEGNVLHGHLSQLLPADEYQGCNLVVMTDPAAISAIPFTDAPNDLAAHDFWVGLRWAGAERQWRSSWVSRNYYLLSRISMKEDKLKD